MFINILPPAVAKEVREKPDCTTLQKCIDHVLSDLGRLNDANLSKLHMERLKQSLSASHRLNPVLSQEENRDEAGAPAIVQKPENQLHLVVNALSEKMESLVAAIAPRPKSRESRAQPQRRTSDFAKFGDKCLHCGSDKHRAKDCPVKKALLEKNGGKFPAGYKSAFDKWKEKQPKRTVSALIDEEDAGSEFSETTLPVWCLPQCAVTSVKAQNGKTDFEHVNPFAPIFDDEDDDEDKIVEALKHISSNVTVGPKMSQKQKKAISSSSLDRKDIAKIAKLVRSGSLGLPELDLDSNSEYYSAWALVDSGAARSCAKRRAHFLHTTTELRPSHVKMATASGEELVSRGCFDLEALSIEGNPISQTFEDADVDMPIMSVGELSGNGELGSNVLFGERDGHVIDIKTLATSKFYKRRGVYFMKIYMRKDRRGDAGFARPGTA
jgi:hypothetical protein